MGDIREKNFKIIYMLIFLFVQFSLIGQDLSDKKNRFTDRTFKISTAEILRSKYLDAQGFPSHKKFLLANGIYPRLIKLDVIPYFKISINKNEIAIKDNIIKSINLSEIINIDFFIERSEKSESAKVAKNIWDGRVYEENDELLVGGYSSNYNERPVGKINSNGEFMVTIEKELVENFPLLSHTHDKIIFDPFQFKLLNIVKNDKEYLIEKSKAYLPIDIYDTDINSKLNIEYSTEIDQTESRLILFGRVNEMKLEVASCKIIDVIISASHNGYRPELIDGCVQSGQGEIITLVLNGEFAESVVVSNGLLTLNETTEIKSVYRKDNYVEKIIIDGKFRDWHNIKGVYDYPGDRVSYLFPNPDTDLLQFKVTNDDEYLYFYSRVVGAHGRTGDKGRYYWYAYIDADSNPKTGYPPTRDDNCYFGIPIGDDCEAQFEFVGNKFIKTFFGFTGIGNEKEVLQGKLVLGPSYYSSTDNFGNKRDKYKIEYVNREGKRYITHDYTEGTSEDIIIGLSADASEVEMRVELKGFLKDTKNEQLLKKGDKIDIAIGVEAASDFYGSDTWGADSTPILYGYEIK